MWELKVHLKLNNKPICGTVKGGRKLRFADKQGDVTCKNCKRAIAK
jgi:hypothetical protein